MGADKDRSVCLEDFVVGRVLGHNIDVVLEQNLGAALKVTDQLPDELLGRSRSTSAMLEHLFMSQSRIARRSS